MRSLALAFALAMALAAVPAGGGPPVSRPLLTPALAAELPGALEEVGHDDLGSRGLNSALALAGHCAYVGSRGQGPIEIVDVADPTHPHRVGSLPGRPLTTARELRAVPERNLLVVLSYALAAGGANRLDLYRWDQDCAHPAAVGAYSFGGRAPHEFYLWQEPGGDRLLLFTAMFSGGAGDLQVIDAADPAAPHLAGTWASPIGLLHSIALSGDGRRAYLSLWRGGLLVADVSQFTSGQPNPQLSLLTPVRAALPPPPGPNANVHSAVPVPGHDLLLLTDERYAANCADGPARLADVSDPARPRAVSVLNAPENDLATCRSSPAGTYTSHNPTLVGDLALVTWYSSGLQVFDVSDPAQPARLAEFRPQAVQPAERDRQLGATLTMTWSYPIVRDGLIYVADINQGLYVLRYRGPHQEQLEEVAFAEGNSNLFKARPPPTPPPTPAPSSGPEVAQAAPAGPPASSRRAAATGRSLPAPALAAAALLGVAALAGLAALLLVRRTRRLS